MVRNFQRLKKRIERLLGTVRIDDEPSMVFIQPDGRRIVLGRDGRRLPDNSATNHCCKIFVGIDFDDI